MPAAHGLGKETIMSNYEVTLTDNLPIKAWTRGVPIEDSAMQQLKNLTTLPFLHKHVAVMPDVHWGMGATVGSVIATCGAIIPAAVGVDIGCGMIALKTDLLASQLPDNLHGMRSAIEAAVPHGRSHSGDAKNDKGAWRYRQEPAYVTEAWRSMQPSYAALCEKHPAISKANTDQHLGTLGTGNHFIEVCIDENQSVWIMLHSGSRGVGGRIGSYFIELAKKEMQRWFIHLPDANLAYLPEGSQYFQDYIEAVFWAQNFAYMSRECMLSATLRAVANSLGKPVGYDFASAAVNCHHNYVARENHFGKNVLVTRKGAVRARQDDLGIIPGSMGARSFIVRGKGNADSFTSCSHGAGRIMSRTEAKRKFTLADHEAATAGVECRKDADVIDETPGAYKDIDAVMAAQADLVDIVHTLRQVVCVKG